ncbi:MAG: ankyrin repeat domain-containing protein [Alphaproteobacteria bacterium]|nr:ankyrin repeat domain-containing protein [Alphaproteobacteria bacterium]
MKRAVFLATLMYSSAAVFGMQVPFESVIGDVSSEKTERKLVKVKDISDSDSESTESEKISYDNLDQGKSSSRPNFFSKIVQERYVLPSETAKELIKTEYIPPEERNANYFSNGNQTSRRLTQSWSTSSSEDSSDSDFNNAISGRDWHSVRVIPEPYSLPDNSDSDSENTSSSEDSSDSDFNNAISGRDRHSVRVIPEPYSLPDNSDSDSESKSSNNSDYQDARDFHVLTEYEVDQLPPKGRIKAFIINKGLDINKINRFGDPILVYAASEGDTDVVKELIENGADVNKRGKYGHTALILASLHGHKSIVEFLLNNTNVDINIVDDAGCSALTRAIMEGHIEITDLLLKKNPELINLKNQHGNTPLSIAIVNCQEALAKFLIENGAKVGEKETDLLYNAEYWFKNKRIKDGRSCSDPEFWKSVIKKLEEENPN